MLAALSQSLIDWLDGKKSAFGTPLGTWADKVNLGTRLTEFRAAIVALQTADTTAAADLASTATGKGASLIGVEDDGAFFTGADVEAVLQEIGNDLPLSFDNGVKATIAVANVGGGGTDAALTVDLTRADGSTVLGAARQILIRTGAAQYTPGQALNGNVTFATPTKGSIIANGAGWCLAKTDADGEFDCTASNATDETVYFWVETAHRVSILADGCVVLASNSDSAAWSA